MVLTMLEEPPPASTTLRPTTADPVGPARRRLLIAVVAVQVLLPACALLEPPSRLGWQMFSGLGGWTVRVEQTSGEVTELPRGDLVAQDRPEIDWRRHLPSQACRQLPDAVRVEVVQNGTGGWVEC